jgi:hypothetical protein
MFAASAALAIPASGVFAAGTSADGVLPDDACHAVYPAHLQAALCGRGTGGPHLD